MVQRDEVIELSNPSLSSFMVEGLSVGLWYFSITAFNSLGVESVHSDLMVFDTQFN